MFSLFITVWSIGALAMGALFVFRPEIPADMYIARASRTRVSDRLRRRLAPRASILVWYRIGGAIFMILGVLIPVLVLAGVLTDTPR